MEFRGLRINIILLVIGIIIIAFFAGKHLYNFYNYDKPLREELAELEGVKTWEIVEKNNKTDVIVSFKPDINFYKVYQELDEIISEKLEHEQVEIIIENQADKDLEKVYYQLHYAIYEGLATNEFVKMEEEVSNIVKNNNLTDYHLWIDNKAVYLELNRKKSSFYKRIPYNQRMVLIRVEEGGSDG